MYLPKHFEENDPELLLEVMRRYNFATLVSVVEGVPFATHLPVLASPAPEGRIVIDMHVAHANPQWRALQQSKQALVIFQGPHAYISPSSFQSKRRVPTWNYVAVHATGPVDVFESAEHKLATLAKLIAFHEPEFASHFDTFEEKMRDGLLGAIVAMSMRVETLEGKFKLNQHRLADDRSDLQEIFLRGDENHRELAHWMERLGFWSSTG